MAFIKFPYTDAHQLNLDWIIKQVQNIPTKISQLINDMDLVNASEAAAAAPVQSVNGMTGDVIVGGGGGAVDSVNGKTGAVVLDASDVGAVPDDALYAGAAVQGGVANGTQAIPYGELDPTSTSTVMTATVPGITSLRNGVTMLLKNGVATSASGVTLNINNLGAKPIYVSMAAASAVSTTFNVNYTMLFVYDEDRVAGGCWVMYYGYNADTNTIGYQLRGSKTNAPVTDKTYRYRLMFQSPDGLSLVPANASSSTSATTQKTPNSRPINPFGLILYFSNTTAVNQNTSPGASYLWSQYAPISLGYSFNDSGAALTLTSFYPVYLKCTPQNDGSALMDGITQALPSTADGKIYIFLGYACSATEIELWIAHPIYYYADGAVRPWTFPVSPLVSSVNNKTGAVVLDASDVGALPDSYTAPVSSVNSKTGAVVLDASDVGALASTAINTSNEISLNAYDINANLTIRAGVYVRSGKTVQVRMTLNILSDILNGEVMFYSDEFKQKMAQTIFIGRCAATANIVGITVATTSTGIEISAAGRIPAGDWTFFTFDCLT